MGSVELSEPFGVVVLGYALTSSSILTRAQAAVDERFEASTGEDAVAMIARETETATAAIGRLRAAGATASRLPNTLVLVDGREYWMDCAHATAAIALDLRAALHLVEQLALLRASLEPAAGRA